MSEQRVQLKSETGKQRLMCEAKTSQIIRTYKSKKHWHAVCLALTFICVFHATLVLFFAYAISIFVSCRLPLQIIKNVEDELVSCHTLCPHLTNIERIPDDF